MLLDMLFSIINWITTTTNIICKLAVFANVNYWSLTRIATPSRVYLIDTGNEGRARDSRHPPPHPPVDLFLTGGRDESR
jgi:hypothetical protein